MLQKRIDVIDEKGASMVALVTHEAFGREVVWSAEIEGMAVEVPLTGTAADEGSIAASVQTTVLRWGITARQG